jgi:hypothetical protein
VDKGVLVFLLPNLDQPALYDSINHDLTVVGAENTTAHSKVVAAYACPDDRLSAQRAAPGLSGGGAGPRLRRLEPAPRRPERPDGRRVGAVRNGRDPVLAL